MDEFLDQIEASCKAGHLYPALFCSLALPDICGAISSADGTANGSRYIAWFNEYVSPKYSGNFDGSNCYAFRCAALHQGKTEHRNLGYERIVFLAPVEGNPCVMHNNIFNEALNLDIVEFSRDIISAVRQWMQNESGNPAYQKHMAAFLRRHEDGLPQYVLGADLFA